MAVVPHVDLSDPISPTLIEHRVEAASHAETGAPLFHYNYLYYQFDLPSGTIWARSYLDDIKRVSLFLPSNMRSDHAEVRKCLSYLALRFQQVDGLDEAGYVKIWPQSDKTDAGSKNGPTAEM
jgi:hypothetical protein